MLLSQTNSHIFISGQTQSGKTFFASRALKELKRPVLFFNIQDEPLNGFMTVYVDKINTDQLLEALKYGEKVDLRFPPNYRLGKINMIIGYLLTQLSDAGFNKDKPVYVAIDECHTLAGDGLEAAIQLATRGLSRGVRGVFITQRPALADKTLYTQSTEHYMFYLSPSESQYFKNKGFEFEKCQELWAKHGQHSYVYYDGKDLIGKGAV